MTLPPTLPKPPPAPGSHGQARTTERTEATHTAAEVTEAPNTAGHASMAQSMLRHGPPRSGWHVTACAPMCTHTYPSRLLLSSPCQREDTTQAGITG